MGLLHTTGGWGRLTGSLIDNGDRSEVNTETRNLKLGQIIMFEMEELSNLGSELLPRSLSSS